MKLLYAHCQHHDVESQVDEDDDDGEPDCFAESLQEHGAEPGEQRKRDADWMIEVRDGTNGL